MREIKFRGLRVDGKCWVYGDLFDHDKIVVHKNKGIRKHKYIEVMPESVGQFTGLNDKNGKEIYEGDILKVVTHGFDLDIFITEIVFNNCAFKFANGRNMFYYRQRDLTVLDDSEIIGNIHEQK